MAKMSEYNTAARLQAIIYQVASKAVENAYPRPRYATVTAVNHTAGTATMAFPDDATAFTLATMMIAPEVSGVVRVAGQEGTRYVDEIKSGGVRVRGVLNVTGLLSASLGIDLVSGQRITFNGASNSMYYISAPSNVPWHQGPRIIGDTGWSFYNNTTTIDEMGYRGAPGANGYGWYAKRLLVGSTPSDSLALNGTIVCNGIMAITGNSLLNWSSHNSTIGLWVQDVTWVRAQPNFYCAGIVGGDGGISAKGGGGLGGYGAGYFVGTVGCTSTMTATKHIGTSNASGGNYTNSGLWADPAAGLASVSLHCGGVAPMMGAVNGFGNQIFSRDSTFAGASGNYTAVGFLTDSSKRWKKNINDWPMKSGGAAVLGATDIIAQLRPVTWEQTYEDVEIPSGRRNEAWQRLNQFNKNKGLEDYKLPLHDCELHDCVGGKDNHCCRYIDSHKSRLGFIAEEVFEVLPSAIMLDPEFIPASIDIAQMTALAIAAVKELTERVAALEGAA